MAEFIVNVGVSKLAQFTAAVRLEAETRSAAEALARAKVRRVLVDGALESLTVTEVARPTYQLHEAHVADSPSVA